MASRDRKRAERQKRKARAAERQAEMTARSEARNQAVRETLQPLAQGERPGAVTVGAIASAVVALFTDVEVQGRRPSVLYLVAVAGLVTAMAVGMWRVRYWAVLGFQAFLVLIILSATLGLITVETLLQAMGTTLVLALSGAMFYFMVKAMARVQMPERQPRE
jgi:hypothetical protein